MKLRSLAEASSDQWLEAPFDAIGTAARVGIWSPCMPTLSPDRFIGCRTIREGH